MGRGSITRRKKHMALASIVLLLSSLLIFVSLDKDSPMHSAVQQIEEQVTQLTLHEKTQQRQLKGSSSSQQQKHRNANKVVEGVKKRVQKAVEKRVEGVTKDLQVVDHLVEKLSHHHQNHYDAHVFRHPPNGYRLPPALPKYIHDGLSTVDWSLTPEKELLHLIKSALTATNQNNIRSQVHKGRVEGIPFYWQLPFGAGPPKGILVLAHARGRSAVDWFSSLSHAAPEEQ